MSDSVRPQRQQPTRLPRPWDSPGKNTGVGCHFLQCMKVKSLSRVRLFVTPWTVAYQAPPSMRFSRQEYWSGVPFPSPGDLPDPGIEPMSLIAPALQMDSLPLAPARKPHNRDNCGKELLYMEPRSSPLQSLHCCSLGLQRVSLNPGPYEKPSNTETYLIIRILTKTVPTVLIPLWAKNTLRNLY